MKFSLTPPEAGRMAHLDAHFFATLSARITALQASGRDIIRLDEGSPDLPPAGFIIEALGDSAARANHHGYQSHRGPIALRSAWCNLYKRLYQVNLDPERDIVPLLGSKEGIFHLSFAYIDPGDIVLVPEPGYVTYARGALMAGGEVYTMPLVDENHFLPDLSAIPGNVLSRAKLMWLNYPNNPTGAVAPVEFFRHAVAVAHEHGLLLCHDAAYTRVTYDGYAAPSLLQVEGANEVAVEFNTLSKSHNMAGWRTAAMMGNRKAVSALYTLKTNADSSQFLPIMEASTAAITGDQEWVVQRNKIYMKRRDAVIRGLRELGLVVDTPKASMYVWSPVPQGWTSMEFVTAALEETGVSLTPGTVFGPSGEGYIRIAFTEPEERISLAMERLRGLMKGVYK